VNQRKFVVIALIVALGVSALTLLTSGLAGMLVYDTTRWLVVYVHGPLEPDRYFVQGYVMGLLWPWLVAAVVILLRQLQAGRGRPPLVRGGLYAGVIYLATLLLSLAVSAG